ncbi:MAG: hypothetical protein FWC95_01845 [Defluviitaleaceae bacterium]|nr:hypothetical protein [Defluviitaleaceae bacterium]
MSIGKIIKADIYRILRGKAIFITLSVLVAVLALNVGLSLAMTRNVFRFAHEDFGRVLQEATTEGEILDTLFRQEPSEQFVFESAVEMMPFILAQADNLIWFILAAVIIIAAPMFTSGAIKNGISTGLCRTKLYLSKFITTSVITVLIYLFTVFASLLVASLVRGFGNPHDLFWGEVFAVIGGHTLVLLAFNSVALFFLFITKRSGATIGIFIAFNLVPPFIFLLLANWMEGFQRLFDFELSSIMRNFTSLFQPLVDEAGNLFGAVNIGFGGLGAMMGGSSVMTTEQILIAICLSAFYIVGGTFFGVLLFKKAEIK